MAKKMTYKGELPLIPLPMAKMLAEHITNYLLQFSANQGYGQDEQPFDLFFGGSMCRAVPFCSDLDLAILVEEPIFIKVAFECLAKEHGVQTLIDGTNIKRYILRFPWQWEHAFQLDVWLTDKPEGWPAMKMFVAGDGQLNAIQRGVANRKGFMLNQYGLYRNGVIIPCTTEQEVYNHLGMKWLDYPDRTIDKSKLARALKG